MRRLATRALRAPLLALLLLAATAAPLAAQSTVVVLVRHAEEQLPDAENSPLSAAGLARVDSLVRTVAHVKLGAVFSTQYLRTRDMAAAVATAQGVPHHVVTAARPHEAWLGALAARIRTEHRGQTVLVVGHSNTTPMLVRALGGPELPTLDEAEFRRYFVLVIDEGGGARLLDARFGG